MLIAGTKANRALAGTVNARVAADASLVRAKAWMIRCGALGVLALAVGGGVGLAFLGVARSRDASGAADRLAATLTQALERSQLHARIDPDSTVKLDPDAHVAMDPAANRVQLDAPLPRPTREQLGPDGRAGGKSDGKPGAAVQTEYTVFKVVPWGGGRVVTGYTFAPDAKMPNHQYCYYADGGDQATYQSTHVAAEGRFIAPANAPTGLDTAKAAAECLWFDGRPTRF